MTILQTYNIPDIDLLINWTNTPSSSRFFFKIFTPLKKTFTLFDLLPHKINVVQGNRICNLMSYLVDTCWNGVVLPLATHTTDNT